MRLVLASSSPRRREILGLLGVPFEILVPDLAEMFDPRRPAPDEAAHWALQKARAVAMAIGGPAGTPVPPGADTVALVIGSDTLIDLARQKIGKPTSPEDALRILKRLAGREHWVVTAVGAVFPDGREKSAIEVVRVKMRAASDDALARYVDTGDPLDKAGGYSLQGAGRDLIESIDGDYLAAVGLPLKPVVRFLLAAGITPPVDVAALYRDRTFLNWRTYQP